MKIYETFAELQDSTQALDGLALFCRENLYTYVVQPSDYVATGEDVTFVNGRVGKASFVADAKYIKTTGGNVQDDIDSIVAGSLPSQANNQFKFLTTNGTGASWAVAAYEVETFAQLEALESVSDGQSFICQERANARYILRELAYIAKPGDVTFANGRVGELQFTKSAIADKFGITYSGDETTLIQSVVNRLAETGGELILTGLVSLSATLSIPQRVIIKGVDYGFANQFINNEVSAKGCGLFMLTGSNVDVVEFKLAVTESGGNLIDDFDGSINNDYRYFGGLKNLVVYGNRSDTANPPSVVDNNTLGSGVVCKGVRYPILENVIIMMCAEEGVKTSSFDYGLGSTSCNNLLFHNVTCLSNARNGASLSGGDSHITKFNLGYNGLSGLSTTVNRCFIGGISWNNELDGINTSSGTDVHLDFQSYDNKRNGFRLSGLNGAIIDGGATANGRNTGLASTERCGVLSASSNQAIVLNVVSNGTYLGTAYQAYGYNISNATHEVVVGSAYSTGNFTNNWLISTPSNLIKGSNAP